MAPVPPDRLPEPLPPGLNLPLVITIQTDGSANFDRPVPVKFPNLPDPVTGVKLPPGAKTALWSFNHDTGRWEIQGSATISADGQLAVTDPGVGVRQPGWHGVAPGTGGSRPRRQDRSDDGPGCPPYCGPRPDPPCNETDPCGNLHYEYTEALHEWQKEAKLKDSYTALSVINLGKKVDEAYAKYVECREVNGRPCQDGPGPASVTRSRTRGGASLASLPVEATSRIDTAVQNTIEEQNHAHSNTSLPGPGAWFALESLEFSNIQRGRLNIAGVVENLVLMPGQPYRMSYYDAVNRRSGSAYFHSKESGETTYIPYARLYGSEFKPQTDTDADGLSDAAEFTLGTAAIKADSDGDGIPDGQEVVTGPHHTGHLQRHEPPRGTLGIAVVS